MINPRLQTDPTAMLSSALDTSAIDRLKRHLSMNVHLISDYGERLLDDTPERQAEVLRLPLLEAMAAARQALSLVRASFDPDMTMMHQRDVSALFDKLKKPQSVVVDRVTSVLRSSDSSSFSEGLLADLRAIRTAAIQLSSAPHADEAPARESTAAARPSAARPPASRPAMTPPDVTQKKARVLVAEDTPDARKLLVAFLKKLGHEVDAFENGALALAKAAEGNYDIVLSDIEMPELDGFGFLEALKKNPATRDLPVVMISGLDDMKSVVRCIEKGAEDHLSKPFEPTLLKARLRTLLDRKRLRDAEAEYLAEVGRVTGAAAAVEAGTYETGLLGEVANRQDALGDLARVFDEMASGVRRRAERMASQLADLQSEIGRLREQESGESPADQARHLGMVPGDVFAGRYQVISILGEGGMGLVVRAHDTTLKEDVAIKTIRSDLVGTPELIERFKTELKLARRLTHKNIVRCHDLAEANGVHYLTMEFVEGVTLRDLILMRGRLTASVTIAVGAQLADALGAAHDQGVVHRDIKPMNLLLTRDGVLKVMDFGIARVIENKQGQTQTGMIVGTPSYMAPEQFFGSGADHRSDLFAMGVVLYECLTGSLPSDVSTLTEHAARLLTEDPTGPSLVVEDLPPALDALVTRLMARKPEERFAHASEVAEALRAIR